MFIIGFLFEATEVLGRLLQRMGESKVSDSLPQWAEESEKIYRDK